VHFRSGALKLEGIQVDLNIGLLAVHNWAKYLREREREEREGERREREGERREGEGERKRERERRMRESV
jgi:hypothetical protein